MRFFLLFLAGFAGSVLLGFVGKPDQQSFRHTAISSQKFAIAEADWYRLAQRVNGPQSTTQLKDVDLSDFKTATQLELQLDAAELAGFEKLGVSTLALGMPQETRNFIDGLPGSPASETGGQLRGLGPAWFITRSLDNRSGDGGLRLSIISEEGPSRSIQPKVLLVPGDQTELARSQVASWLDLLVLIATVSGWTCFLCGFTGWLSGERQRLYGGTLLFGFASLLWQYLPPLGIYTFAVQGGTWIAGMAGLVLASVAATSDERVWRPLIFGVLTAAALAWLTGGIIHFSNPATDFSLGLLHFANAGFAPFALILIPILLLADLKSVGARMVGSAKEIRARDKIIADQAAEIEETVRRQAVMEERQRFVRDMHDGVGGQLLSLLMRVRSGNIGNDGIETEIEKGITDLRLVVDSLDQVGTDLETALATFRARAEQQLAGSGIAFDWEQSGPVGRWRFDARGNLGIFRILQEALANAARHAGAQRIGIVVEAGDPGDGELRIALSDDGKGFDPAQESPGRGLQNLNKRGENLGGSTRIESAPGSGTRVVLTVPAGAQRERGTKAPASHS